MVAIGGVALAFECLTSEEAEAVDEEGWGR
jgi:hypothetical protein